MILLAKENVVNNVMDHVFIMSSAYLPWRATCSISDQMKVDPRINWYIFLLYMKCICICPS